MLIWLIFAGITAAVLAGLLAPLWRPGKREAEAAAFDRAVYRDQLREIEADVERGLVSAEDAESARIEVSRRLLAAADDPALADRRPFAPPIADRSLAYGVGGGIALVAIGLYLVAGAPDLPGRPYGSRGKIPAGEQQINDLVAQVEERLRQRPEDGAGWDVLGPVYLRQERYSEAADAFEKAIRLLGETPKRLAGLGEALITLDNGMVNAPAREAFEKLLKSEPGRPDARFWLAMAKEQGGNTAEAAADYRALLSEAPPDAPWRKSVSDRLAALGALPAETPSGAGRAGRGPSAGDVAAAQGLAPEARDRMILGMVEGLAQRLKREPKDVEGWLKLIRAYWVLGRREDAAQAALDARKHLAGETKAVRAIDALAQELGLGS